MHALASGIAVRYRPIPYVAAGCGLRGSEIFGLEVDDVDFSRREIRVHRQLKRLLGQPAYVGELKSKSSRRTIEMPEVVRVALVRRIERFPPVETEIEDRTDHRNVHRRIARLLFDCGRPSVAPVQLVRGVAGRRSHS